jgi:hypothetical protein
LAAAKLKDPKVITDFNQPILCLLPVGFYFDDGRWDTIWQRYDEKGDTLSMADLNKLFPDEESVQFPPVETGETFDHKADKE